MSSPWGRGGHGNRSVSQLAGPYTWAQAPVNRAFPSLLPMQWIYTVSSQQWGDGCKVASPWWRAINAAVTLGPFTSCPTRPPACLTPLPWGSQGRYPHSGQVQGFYHLLRSQRLASVWLDTEAGGQHTCKTKPSSGHETQGSGVGRDLGGHVGRSGMTKARSSHLLRSLVLSLNSYDGSTCLLLATLSVGPVHLALLSAT